MEFNASKSHVMKMKFVVEVLLALAGVFHHIHSTPNLPTPTLTPNSKIIKLMFLIVSQIKLILDMGVPPKPGSVQCQVFFNPLAHNPQPPYSNTQK